MSDRSRPFELWDESLGCGLGRFASEGEALAHASRYLPPQQLAKVTLRRVEDSVVVAGAGALLARLTNDKE